MACCFDSRTRVDERGQGSILYSILNNGHHDACAARRQDAAARHRVCPCAPSEKKVVIRAPRTAVFEAVSVVLLNTFRFVKNDVPSLRALPARDRLRLARHGWAPLLLLGMAQARVGFETVEAREPSLLHRILTDGARGERADGARDRGVSSARAQEIQVFLLRCRELDISGREYALLKVIVLFNPGIAGLERAALVGALQREARQALGDHVRTAHRGDATRLSGLHGALGALRAVHAHVVAGLFLQPTVHGRSAADGLRGY